ncbi:MAG: Uncharacterized MFS-type transporter [uncultured Chloroflexia bacterium]|uniref:Uncharacterized MFS-type transporter n=1 Tax=uncultured Chloroflexia bacterium TaxID=1672391 RepID=A0A6J4NGZ7_9CHLR|nr:MAG: Uncharacterized MFS-type transporter [uncultured Chloroflexia bacterium]
MTATSGEVSLRTILSYAVLIWPLALGQASLTYVAPYYSQQLGLQLALVGGLLAAGRFYDMLCDITVGALSDRTTSRFGRRRPWVLIGMLLFIPALWVLFVPGSQISVTRYALGLLIFFTGWTTAMIPYLSQGSEITHDHRKRGDINVLQSTVILLALFAAFALPFLLVDTRMQGVREGLSNFVAGLGSWSAPVVEFLRAEKPQGVAGYGQVMLIITIATSLGAPMALVLYLAFVPDRQTAIEGNKGGKVNAALLNPVFARFNLGFVMIAVGYLSSQTLMPFIVVNALGLPNSFLYLLLIWFMASIVSLPFWTAAYRRFERTTCLTTAAFIEALGLLIVALSPPGHETFVLVGFILRGIPGQVLLMAPYLIASDCADYAHWKTGADTKGVHVSLISVIIKLGLLSGAGAIWLIGSLGFSPSVPVSSNVSLVLKLTALWLPAALLTAGGLVIAGFPITRKRQRAIQRRLDLRTGAMKAAAMV